MRKIKEIRQELAEEIKRCETATEKEPILNKINGLVKELEAAERAESEAQDKAAKAFAKSQEKNGNFSFLKFIKEASEGRGFTGVEAEAYELGKEEAQRLGLSTNGAYLPSSVLKAASGQNYTTDADGGYLKETGSIRYLEALKERLVLTQLGASYLSNLVGTIPFVTDSNVTASWNAEGGELDVSKIAFSKATMTPKRVGVQGVFTKDLLRQTSIDVENIVMNKLAEAHAVAIEKAAINGSGTSNEPTGILNTTGIGSVAGGANGAAISWANVVALETAVNANNGSINSLGYLTNAKVVGALKTTEMATNTARFLLDPLANTLNGYDIKWTNLVPSNLTKGTTATSCSAMIFGDFSQLYIGQWGGIDVVVDPYTKAGTAEIVITLNAWNDVLVARPKSFAAIKDITIA